MQGYDDLLDLLIEIRNFFDSPNTNVLWSRYEKVEHVITDLDVIRQRLEQRDRKVISELKILFAPTGAYQEISISSDCGEKFVELAARFDHIIKSTRLD